MELSYLLEKQVNLSQSERIRAIYGDDAASLDSVNNRLADLAARFRDYFPGISDVRLFSTPGRTEVSGNHTDHQQGRVLCAAVSLDVIALVAPNDSNVIELKSFGFARMDRVNLNLLDPQEDEVGHSASLIRGVAAGIKAKGGKIGGFTAYTTSNVPAGSGLSSSAAFEILVGTILNELYNEGQFSMVELAQIGQMAENEFFGKPSGLMDQCGCAVGGFISIDFEDVKNPLVKHIDVDFNAAGYELIITKTDGSHADLTDEYAAIPAEMKAIAADFDARVLREVDPKAFFESIAELRKKHGDRAVLRSMHFFAENERVSTAASALSDNDISTFLDTIKSSGLSSWTLLQNVSSHRSNISQPIAMALAISEEVLAGEGAVRVHGGGFAGTIQAFVPREKVKQYVDSMATLFGHENVLELAIRDLPSCEIDLVI